MYPFKQHFGNLNIFSVVGQCDIDCKLAGKLLAEGDEKCAYSLRGHFLVIPERQRLRQFDQMRNAVGRPHIF